MEALKRGREREETGGVEASTMYTSVRIHVSYF